jgi:hypothetical protein
MCCLNRFKRTVLLNIESLSYIKNYQLILRKLIATAKKNYFDKYFAYQQQNKTVMALYKQRNCIYSVPGT